MLQNQRFKLDSTLEGYIRVWKHDEIPSDELVIVDLSFLPEIFWDNPGLEEIHQATLASDIMANGSMTYYQLPDKKKPFDFGGQEEFTKILIDAIDSVLVAYAGMDSKYQHTTLEASFLTTTENSFEQDPHIDYEWTSINRMKERCNGLLPWLGDLPLETGGLKLNFFREQNKLPKTIECPPKHLVLWRADQIHGGGFRNSLDQNAWRMHLFLPLCKFHEGSHKSVKSIICWFDENKERFTKKFRKSNGDSFIKRKERDQDKDDLILNPIKRPTIDSKRVLHSSSESHGK